MRIAIVGARRNLSGIGGYAAKHLHAAGAAVVSVVGTTIESSERAASELCEYGISAQPRTSLEQAAINDRPDAVVVSSPAVTHAMYVGQAIDMGLHVLCEKPFVWCHDNIGVTQSLLGRARSAGITVAMNSQWPFTLDSYDAILKPARPSHRTFLMEMSPFQIGRDMIPEAIPHLLSILYHRLGPGRIDDVCIRRSGDGKIDLSFNYDAAEKCNVVGTLTGGRVPRELTFGFGGMLVKRVIGPNYGLTFNHGGRSIDVEDPLRSSVRDFMGAVMNDREPAIGPAHIIDTVILLDQIYHASEGLWES